MSSLDRWRSVPRSSLVIFLVAVFFVFASFGFVSDSIDMGLQPPARFALTVLIAGLFSVAYAAVGIRLKGRFWIGCLPLFALHFICMGVVANRFPEPPHPAVLSAAQTVTLQSRLAFDGLAIILSICLGYAGFVYVSIAEGRRHGRAQMEKATLEGEMTAAREVQRVMVPEELPAVANYAIDSVYRPASEVGGDFFQVVPLASGRTLVVIGDVSGKGLRAAMIVSMIVGALRTVCGYTEEPAAILAELNRRLKGRVHEGFATCLALRLDEQGALTLANAGHIPPYLNGSEVRTPGSLPLGLDENAEYDQSTLHIEIGDVIVLLTDGIAEAQNKQHALFGFARIESALRAPGATAKSVAEMAQHHGQNDDITILSIARRL